MTTGIPNSCAERARASRFRRVCSGSWIRLNKPSCWSTSSSTAFCGVTGSRRVGLVALGMAWSPLSGSRCGWNDGWLVPCGTSQRPLVVAFLVDAPLWEGTPHPASGKKDIVGLYLANMGLHHVVTLTLDGCVLTSAGVAAGLDLCLHVVRRDHGAATAASIARHTVVAPHRDGDQAQFIEQPIPAPERGGTSLLATRSWALDHLHERLDLARLARNAGVSPRTFARRFRAETGTTPLQWILAQRVLLARQLLEQTDLPVESVAHACGFSTATHLRRHFTRATGTTPTAYRRAFTLRT